MRCILPSANEVWGKVIFLHLFVILFTGGGFCLSACWDTTHPQTRHPSTRHPPPRAVRILLECNLVLIKFAFYLQYYHYIEIAIKQCKGSGIDCKVHGLSVVGRLKSDDDEGTASFTFLASDNEEEEERSNIPQVAAGKQKLKHAGLCQVSLNLKKNNPLVFKTSKGSFILERKRK